MSLARALAPAGGSARAAAVRQIMCSRPGATPVSAWLAHPTHVADGKRLAVVMHGTRRNAREYLETWREWSRQTGRPVLAPQLDREAWPGARGYNLGNVLDERGRCNPRRSWSFTAVRDLVVDTRQLLELTDLTWDLFGHSAGAQFAHRLALLRPSSTLRSVVVAGAGWFTVPDPSSDWPYGTRHPDLGIDRPAMSAWTRRPIVLMRGEHDRLRDEHLRTDPEADAHGRTRWDRAATMLAAGRAYDDGCRWQLVDVLGAGHDERAIAPAVQALWSRTS